MTDRARFDQNYNNTLIASSNAGDGAIVEIWADPTTHALKVDASISVDAGFNLQQVGGANIALGQALASASLPVVLTSAQLTTLTPPTAVGSTSGAVTVGQQTVNTSAVQLSAGSVVPTNGIIVEALSTNAASVFVGGSGVATSTGFELQPGQAISFTCNLNTLYIISVASTTDKICYNVV